MSSLPFLPSLVFYLLVGCIYIFIAMFVKHTQPLVVVGLYFLLTVWGTCLVMLKISSLLAFCVFMTNVSGLLVLISYCMALHPVDKKKLDKTKSLFNRTFVKNSSSGEAVFNFLKPVLGIYSPGKVGAEALKGLGILISVVVSVGCVVAFLGGLVTLVWVFPVSSEGAIFRFVWSFVMTPLWVVCIAGLSLFVFIVITGCVNICSKYHGALVGEGWKKKSSKAI